MTEAPKEIVELVKRFEEQKDSYNNKGYKEASLRVDFLNPFFEALGWDVGNKLGYAEPYRDVVTEDRLRIGGETKAPDYSFRIGGEKSRKFFVEAKQPAVNIFVDSTTAYQLRRYAWSAHLSLSILTNFKQMSIYDCRFRPDKQDGAAVARVMQFKYEEYLTRWAEIVGIFSREAILKGSFDRYAEDTKAKRGTAEIDDVFLGEIDGWRLALARNFALRNPALSIKELNTAVQLTIDRLVFLRICESRGLEILNQLQGLLNGENIYGRLIAIYKSADRKYNSGLFHFESEKGRENFDQLTLGLSVDDKVLKEIISRLYYPESPYEFSAIPPEILGQVYERFLGKVIRLTEGHQAKVEEKPEVRKAGGVYYTPTYIVDYIVKNTVGKLVEGKTPEQAAKLKVLDPACGSGSFLIGAYQQLLDWHFDYYVKDPGKYAKGRNPALVQKSDGTYKLTLSERKRILMDNIFGVDIDAQAVEVTRLSLLLKVLEGENQQTLIVGRALPDLSSNIKCGNSLIGSDFLDGKQLDSDEIARINPFDWEKEFSQVFPTPSPMVPNGRGQGEGKEGKGEGGGFDAVIGNPPYGYMMDEDSKQYFYKKYSNQDYQLDFYLLFLEKYYSLLKENGFLGVIVSNTWLQSITLKKIRKYLINSYSWKKILHLPEKIFKAVIDTHVLIFEKCIPSSDNTFDVDIRTEGNCKLSHRLKQHKLPNNGDPINIIADSKKQDLYNKIVNTNKPLSTFCRPWTGIKPFQVGKGKPTQTRKIVDEKPFVKEGDRPDLNWSPLLRGSLINRYINLWNNDYWIKYGEWLAEPKFPELFEAPEKIVVRQTGDSIIGVIVGAGVYLRNNLHILLPKDKDINLNYILGILNSNLIDFVYTIINPEKGEALAEIKKEHIEKLPIRIIDFSNKKEVAMHDKMVVLVEQMLDLNTRLQSAKLPNERDLLSRQIAATDRQIGQLVYELYNLSSDEIAIIEEKFVC